MKGWYLITHNLHGFQVVTSKISALDVEIYSPTKIEIKRRLDCKGTRVTEKQLFPGYLFLRFDPEAVHTTTISDIPGVKGFVRFGTKISMVSDSLIEALKQSLLLKSDQALLNVECRNVSSETVASLHSITKMRSQPERQAALFKLLEQDAQILRMSSRPYSRICSTTNNAC